MGLLLSIGCTEKEETPKVTYMEPQSEMKVPEVKIDSSQIKVSDLPVIWKVQNI